MTTTKRSEKTKQRFLSVYEELSDDMFSFCYARTNNREIALDLVQDIFMSTWDYISRGNVVQNLRAFLYRTARNKITDYYRKHKSLSLDAALESGFDLSDSSMSLAYVTNQIEADFSLRALSSLSPKHYQIIQMRFVSQMSLDEMAFSLKENKNTVSVRLHRALAEAKEFLTSPASEEVENTI